MRHVAHGQARMNAAGWAPGEVRTDDAAHPDVRKLLHLDVYTAIDEQ